MEPLALVLRAGLRLVQTQPAKGHRHNLRKRPVGAAGVRNAVDVPRAPTIPGVQQAAVRLVHEAAKLGVGVRVVAYDDHATVLTAFARRLKLDDVNPCPGLEEVVAEVHSVPWIVIAERFLDHGQGGFGRKPHRRSLIRVSDPHSPPPALLIEHHGSGNQPRNHSAVLVKRFHVDLHRPGTCTNRSFIPREGAVDRDSTVHRCGPLSVPDPPVMAGRR